MGGAAVGGVPMGGMPVGGVPIGGIPVDGEPVAGVTVGGGAEMLSSGGVLGIASPFCDLPRTAASTFVPDEESLTEVELELPKQFNDPLLMLWSKICAV